MSQDLPEGSDRRSREGLTSPSGDLVTDSAGGGRVALADFTLNIDASALVGSSSPSSMDKRAASFQTFSGQNASLLAKAGFRLVGEDKIRCDSCGISVTNASLLSDPLETHLTMAPSCPFLKEVNGGSLAKPAFKSQNAKEAEEKTQASPQTSPTPQASPQEKGEGSPKPQVTSTYDIKYREYATVDARVKSFVGWPQQVVKQEPLKMAICGFFYIGSADRVRCFSCGTTLRNWEPGDDPFKEHLTWAPKCNFIKAIRKPEGPPSSTSPPPSTVAAPTVASPAASAPRAAVQSSVDRPDNGSKVNRPEVKATVTQAESGGESLARYFTGGSFGTADRSLGGNGNSGVTQAIQRMASPLNPLTRGGCNNNNNNNSHPPASTGRSQQATHSTRAQASSRPSTASVAAPTSRNDVMASPQVQAVLEMGLTRAAVESALSQRKSAGLGEFQNAVELYEAAERFVAVT